MTMENKLDNVQRTLDGMDSKLDRLADIQFAITKMQRDIEEVRLTKRRKMLLNRELLDLVDRCQQLSLGLQPPLQITRLSPRTAAAIAQAALAWMEFHPHMVPDTKKCDPTSRLCWALLVGQLDHLFVITPTFVWESNKVGRPLIMTVQQVKKQMHFQFEHSGLENACCFVRFYDKRNPTLDGHSMVVIKQGTQVHTLQSYVGISELVCLEGNRATRLFQMDAHAQPEDIVEVDASTFDLPPSPPWQVDRLQCVYIFQKL